MQLNIDSDGDTAPAAHFETDDVAAGGRIGRLRKKPAETAAKTTALTIDKEMLSKDISYLIRELHDEAMNFKEVSQKLSTKFNNIVFLLLGTI